MILGPRVDFATPASEATLNAVANRLTERNFEVVLISTAAEAKAAVLDRIAKGAEVHSGKSKTLEDITVFKELMESDRFDFVRKRTFKMDRKTQMREITKLGAAPDYMVGSVQALTEAGPARHCFRHRKPTRPLRVRSTNPDPGGRQPEDCPQPR